MMLHARGKMGVLYLKIRGLGIGGERAKELKKQKYLKTKVINIQIDIHQGVSLTAGIYIRIR
jgi:hypothetical protein